MPAEQATTGSPIEVTISAAEDTAIEPPVTTIEVEPIEEPDEAQAIEHKPVRSRRKRRRHSTTPPTPAPVAESVAARPPIAATVAARPPTSPSSDFIATAAANELLREQLEFTNAQLQETRRHYLEMQRQMFANTKRELHRLEHERALANLANEQRRFDSHMGKGPAANSPLPRLGETICDAILTLDGYFHGGAA